MRALSERNSMGMSRREWGRRAAAYLAAGAAVPVVTEFSLAEAHAQDLKQFAAIPESMVRLNANENPLGPCPAAIEAVRANAPQGGRYAFRLANKFVETLAEVEGLDPSYILPFAGSSDPLHGSAMAFTSPKRSLVMADPGFEAPAGAARFTGAKVHMIPLAKDYSHDAAKMLAADSAAGVIYVCNPNNPTGTVTKKADIDRIVAEKPKDCVVLVDEAYIHFSKSAESAKDHVAAGRDVIVLRTFSKLYGMAGLRAGAAFARPDLLERLRKFSAVGMLPGSGMVAATASLEDKTLVPTRRQAAAEVRESLFAWLDKKGYGYIPSEANMVMIDGKRPGREVVGEVLKHGVAIGRSWPAMPNHVRVTIGTKDDMEKFKSAFEKVVA